MSNTPSITYTPEKTTAGAAWYDSISGSYSKASNTSSADSMDPVSISFLVPDGYEASLSASIGVDDWGTLEITNTQTGAKVLVLSLTSDDDDSGPNGGHTYWEKSGTVTLSAGTYAISVSHQNITYPADKDPKYNAASCNFSITATKTHLPHTVSTSYTIPINSTRVSLNCPIQIIADCSQTENCAKSIENVRISSIGTQTAVVADADGSINRITLNSVSVEFSTETIFDESSGIAARRVRVSWTGTIWDHSEAEFSEEGRFVSANSDIATSGRDPTISCTL